MVHRQSINFLHVNSISITLILNTSGQGLGAECGLGLRALALPWKGIMKSRDPLVLQIHSLLLCPVPCPGRPAHGAYIHGLPWALASGWIPPMGGDGRVGRE